MNTMSAASTDVAVEQTHEHAAPSGDSLKPAGVSLSELPPSDKPLIAVDLDDVLSQTNRVVAECAQSFSAGIHLLLKKYYRA